MAAVIDIIPPTELMIDDVFTRLIFGVARQWDEQELLIMRALSQLDEDVSHYGEFELGSYLRALGVQEMILLVSQVMDQLRLKSPFAAKYW